MNEQEPFYTAQEINELRTSCQHYKLEAPYVFWTKTAKELRKACNGAGPDRWDACKRRAVTAALKQYEPAFAIHDVEYEYKVGTQKEADVRLYKNMVRIWKRDFGALRWLSIPALIERFKVIPFIYTIVALGGSLAWKESNND